MDSNLEKAMGACKRDAKDKSLLIYAKVLAV